jgi:hypothetical protein
VASTGTSNAAHCWHVGDAVLDEVGVAICGDRQGVER